MSTLPFSADDVIAAFDRHPEIKPIFSSFFLWDCEDRVTECCGLSILAIDAGHINLLASIPRSIPEFVAKLRKAMNWPGETDPDKMKFSEPERQFISGFDCGAREDRLFRSQRENEDFMVGFRTRQLLKNRIKWRSAQPMPGSFSSE